MKIGITPDQFWRMTPKELHFMHQGYLWRRDDRGVMLSNFTAAIVNPHVKRRIKPADLYRPVVSDKKKPRLSLADRQKRFEEAVKLMGPDTLPVKVK